jgi:hypothetical protein
MSAPERALRDEAVRQYCRVLRLPTVAGQFGRMAEEAVRTGAIPGSAARRRD